MSRFERMWARLPDTLKSESIKKFYSSIADILDYYEQKQEPYIYTRVISELKSGMLDIYGAQFGVFRNDLNDDAYKRKINIEKSKQNFVPTWNNFIGIVKYITGYEVYGMEGWRLDPPQNAVLNLEITIPAGSDQDLLFDLDKLYSCGVRIDWIVRQESYIPLELIGPHNYMGTKHIYKSKERILDETNKL